MLRPAPLRTLWAEQSVGKESVEN